MNYLSNCDRFGSVLGNVAAFFRKIAFDIDREPEAIVKYQTHPEINHFVLTEKQTCLERVKSYEALGYGDAGVLLACPGASLAGLIIDEIGNETQRYLFHEYVKKEKACTFLAVTEPEYGSHLGSLNTRLILNKTDKNYFILTGEKWLVGHGGTGMIGVVIVRTHDGPLGVRAVLITQDELMKDTIQRFVLPMTGLRGARLGRLIFKEHRIESHALLGSHLNAVEGGMVALIKTFNRMRPCVGALAIGTAQAVIDYLYLNISTRSISLRRTLKLLNQKIAISRELLYQAAERVEHNPYESGYSSLAKVKATNLAEEVVKMTVNRMGKGCLIEHPFLEKWYRDIWGFEYMEGTQNIHRINTFNSYHSNHLQFNWEESHATSQNDK